MILAVALCAAAFAPAASAVAIPREQFCVPSTLVDYAPPSGLPSVRGLPPSSQLPFAPSSRVRFDRDQRPGLPPEVGLTNRGLLFGLGALGTGGVRVDWKIESLLMPINAKGKAARKPAAKRVQRVRRVRSGPGQSIGLRPNTFKAGLYRLDIVFRDGDGKRLGRYSTYFKISAPHSEFGLAVNGTSFNPTETVFVQVRNPGTDILYYGDDYLLERLVGETWVTVVAQKAIAVGGTELSLGRADGCDSNYTIPADAEGGRYRLSKSMYTFRPQTPVSASVEFDIAATIDY